MWSYKNKLNKKFIGKPISNRYKKRGIKIETKLENENWFVIIIIKILTPITLLISGAYFGFIFDLRLSEQNNILNKEFERNLLKEKEKFSYNKEREKELIKNISQHFNIILESNDINNSFKASNDLFFKELASFGYSFGSLQRAETRFRKMIRIYYGKKNKYNKKTDKMELINFESVYIEKYKKILQHMIILTKEQMIKLVEKRGSHNDLDIYIISESILRVTNMVSRTERYYKKKFKKTKFQKCESGIEAFQRLNNKIFELTKKDLETIGGSGCGKIGGESLYGWDGNKINNNFYKKIEK